MLNLNSMSKNTVYACLLGFVGASLMVLCQTYSSMVFISNYPANKLPYLYLISGLATGISMHLLRKSMERSLSRFAISTHIAFIALYIPFIWLLPLNMAYIPSLFSNLLLIMVGFTNATYILVQMQSFTLREYKALVKWLSASSTMGAIIWGPLIPILLKIGPSILLLYLIIILMVIALVVIKLSKTESPVQSTKVEAPSTTMSLFKNPLFLYLFITGILAQVIQIFADFAPKSLLTSYSQEEIGNILGPFYSCVNVVAILAQIFVSGRIIRRFGIFGILLSLPILVIPVAIGLLIYPHLWVALIFSGIALSSRYGFYVSGQQMVMNVLPDSVLNNARYQMGSIGRNLGVAVAALILILLNLMGGLRITAIGSIIVSALLFYYFRLSQKKYKQALIESINLHRFNLDYVNSVETDRFIINGNAEAALKSDVVDVQLFGLELLSHTHHNTVPEAVYQMLSSDSENVKISALKVIDSIHDPTAWVKLREHLDHENNSEIIWRLINIILHSDYTTLLPFAVDNINSADPYRKSSAICIFLKGGNLDQVIMSLEFFKRLINDPNPTCRVAASEVLNSAHVGNLSGTLIQLLNDENEEVIAKAIKAARRYPSEEVINAILNNLRFKNLYHKIGKTLVSFGPETINHLMIKIKDEKDTHLIVMLVNILSILPEDSAEAELMNLLDYPEIKIQNPAARSIAYRSLTFPFKKGDKKILTQKVDELIALIQNLMQFSEKEADGHIRDELGSRIFLARRRYLHLIVALCENKVILQLIPTLMYSERRSSIYSKALELLDINITDRSLAATIEFALENRRKPGISNQLEITSLSDPWLNELIAFKNGNIQGDKMDIINKILVLREVALFKNLSAEALESIAETITVVDVLPNQQIFKEGDIANGLYIVAKGNIAVTKENVLLREYHEKEFFGELALMDNEPRTGTATSSTESVLYLLEKSDFNRLTDDIPEILKVIVQTIMTYLRPHLVSAKVH